MKKRLLAGVLSLLVAIALVSCNKNEEKPVTDDEKTPVVQQGGTETTPDDDVEKDEDYYLSSLSQDRYDGYNYRMLVRKGATGTQYFDEPQEDIVNDAIYRRNRAVEDKYGITISVFESSGSSDTDALNSILAGEDAYDVIFAHSFSAFSYAVQGACYNIREISTIHPEKPWWAANVAKDCTVNGRLYVLDGDISLSLANAGAIVFNKAIFDELGFDYPYELVTDGEWTFDEFAYLAKKGAKDLNGNGVLEPEFDRFGFAGGGWGAGINILYAGGQKVYTVTDTGDIELSLYSSKTVEVFDEFRSLLNAEGCAKDNGELGVQAFRDGRIMLYPGSLSDAQTLRDMDDEFGIVPYPKFDEDDEYATVIGGHAPLMVIPLTVQEPETTGAITEALCAYGSMEVLPAYYEKSLKTKYSRDDESEEMMDIVKDSIVFDLGYLSGSPVGTVGKTIFDDDSLDFASYWAANKDAAATALEKFKEDYGGIKN